MNVIDYDSIRSTHPLASYCQQKGIELRKRSNLLIGPCPLHNESTPSFHVYPDQHYHCYGCGAHGDVADLELALGGGTKREAAERLGARRIDKIEKKPEPKKEKPGKQYHPKLLKLTERELSCISENRPICVEALHIAVDRGFLWTTDLHKHLAWVISDESRNSYIARWWTGKNGSI
jgi:hypothetical protein